MQLYWIPIRDWNLDWLAQLHGLTGELQLYWIPIRDWNGTEYMATFNQWLQLQLYWIPIRDWNVVDRPVELDIPRCNYIESLLGIETDFS